MKARTFKLYRPNKAADGVSYLAPEISPLEGCLFSDGSLAVRWMTLAHSTAVWDGHTPQDVANRLRAALTTKRSE